MYSTRIVNLRQQMAHQNLHLTADNTEGCFAVLKVKKDTLTTRNTLSYFYIYLEHVEGKGRSYIV